MGSSAQRSSSLTTNVVDLVDASAKRGPEVSFFDGLPVYVKELISGGAAGGFAKSAIAPLKRTKILLQVENLQPSGGVKYKNTMDGLKFIIRNQGWQKLFAGLSINYIKMVQT